MIIQSLQEALALPPGRFYLQDAFCDLEGRVTEKNLTDAVKQLYLQFPLTATCQAQIISMAYKLNHPAAPCRWELPEEKTP